MVKTQINDFDAVAAGRYQGDLSTPHLKEPVPRFIKEVMDGRLWSGSFGPCISASKKINSESGTVNTGVAERGIA